MLRGSRLASQTGRQGGFEVGAGLVRPITAYLLAVAVGVAGFYALAGRIPDAGPALFLIAGAALACIPAAALTLELVHRLRPGGWVARAAIGAVAWIGWGLLVTVVLSTMSRLTLVSEMMVAGLVLCGAAGAVFVTLGIGSEPARPRSALVIVALVVVILVVIGAGLMAGHWGSTA